MKNLILGPIFGQFVHIWALKKFFVGFTLTNSFTLFQAIIQCNFQENQSTKREKMAKKYNFGPNFGLIDPTLGTKLFL